MWDKPWKDIIRLQCDAVLRRRMSMAKIGNVFKFSVAGILGFSVGVIVYILVAWLIVSANPGAAGGWLLVYAIIGFPFLGMPLASFLSIVATTYMKAKIDSVSSPTEEKFNTRILVVIVVSLLSLTIFVPIFVSKRLNIGRKPHPDGIVKAYDSQTGELAEEFILSNGERNGISKSYYRDGRYGETPYKNGRIDGVQKLYCNQNSQAHWETDWKDGEGIKGNDVDRCYDENGNLVGLMMGEYACCKEISKR